MDDSPAKEIGVLALAVLIAALGGEFYLTQFAPPEFTDAVLTTRYGLPAYQANSTIRHRARNRLFDVVYHSNDRGFRGGNFSDEKPPRTYRIEVIGNCLAWGLGVEDDQTFPWLLEKKLNAAKTGGLSYQVVNLGLSSHTIEQHPLVFKDVGIRLSPDCVVIQFSFITGLGDNILADNGRDFLQKLPGYAFLVKTSNLWAHIRQWYAAASSPRLDETASAAAPPDPRAQREAQEKYIRIFDDFIRMIRSRNIQVVVFTDFFEFQEYPLVNEYLRAQAANDKGFHILSIDGIYSKPEFSSGEGHWSPRGHEHIAEKLSELFGKEGMGHAVL